MKLHLGFDRKYAIGVAIIIIGLGVINSWAQPIKVHKQFISLWHQEEANSVLVQGLAGAIQGDSKTIEVYVEIAASGLKTPIELKADGSFSQSVNAAIDDQLRVWARNPLDYKMKSYGTFYVSEAKQIVPEEVKVEQGGGRLSQSKMQVSRWSSDKPVNDNGDAQQLAFVFNVIDLNTGEIIEARRVAGSTCYSVAQKSRVKMLTEKVLNKCTQTIEAEFRPGNPPMPKQNKVSETNN